MELFWTVLPNVLVHSQHIDTSSTTHLVITQTFTTTIHLQIFPSKLQEMEHYDSTHQINQTIANSTTLVEEITYYKQKGAIILTTRFNAASILTPDFL